MSRNERRIFFESLCQLRDRYADLPAADLTPVVSIEAVVAAAAELLREPIAEVVPADEPKR